MKRSLFKYSYAIAFLIVFIIAAPFVYPKLMDSFGISFESPEQSGEQPPSVNEQANLGVLDLLPENGSFVVPIPGTEPEPEPEPLEFTTADISYYDDALFIGDSRTVGLYEYADMGGADFFCSVGINMFDFLEHDTTIKTAGGRTFRQVLADKTYGKIYIGLGINDLPTDHDKVINEYCRIIEYIREVQPDAILFICDNMHVTTERSDGDPTYNNPAIDKINDSVMHYVDEQSVINIDTNELFDDETGGLRSDITGDGVHIYGKYYAEWGQRLLTKAIIKPVE